MITLTGAIHQTGKSRLDEAQYKQPSRSVALVAYYTGCGLRVGDILGCRFVPLVGEHAWKPPSQQSPGACGVTAAPQ